MDDFLNPHQSILNALKEKSSLKQDVFAQVFTSFKLLKLLAKELAIELGEKAKIIDPRLAVTYSDKGDFQFELKVAGDILIFQMHTNIFDFDKNHYIKKFSYVMQDNDRSYCGLINVYNFLADSFKYGRLNDIGYLLARIFINKETHYFIEGKNRNMTMQHEDFSKEIFTKEKAKLLLEQLVLSCLVFDLHTPPFETQREITVSEINETNIFSNLQTGKRLGFKFQMEDKASGNNTNG